MIVDSHRVSLAWRRIDSATLRLDVESSQCWIVDVKKFSGYGTSGGALRDGYVWKRSNFEALSLSLDEAAEVFVAAIRFSVIYGNFNFDVGHMKVADLFYYMSKVEVSITIFKRDKMCLNCSIISTQVM